MNQRYVPTQEERGIIAGHFFRSYRTQVSQGMDERNLQLFEKSGIYETIDQAVEDLARIRARASPRALLSISQSYNLIKSIGVPTLVGTLIGGIADGPNGAREGAYLGAGFGTAKIVLYNLLTLYKLKRDIPTSEALFDDENISAHLNSNISRAKVVSKSPIDTARVQLIESLGRKKGFGFLDLFLYGGAVASNTGAFATEAFVYNLTPLPSVNLGRVASIGFFEGISQFGIKKVEHFIFDKRLKKVQQKLTDVSPDQIDSLIGSLILRWYDDEIPGLTKAKLALHASLRELSQGTFLEK